jgi:N-acyl-L-homoserine lactone synthetase
MEPILAATMYADRRRQFKERLGWAVSVDSQGYERDEYDSENPLYIILADQHGHHAGSMRLLPTTGPTMINDHFLEALHNREVRSSQIWECTRFCVGLGQDYSVTSALLYVCARVAQQANLEKIVAIFDPKMIKVYKRKGVEPEVIGIHEYPSGQVVAGYWAFNSQKCAALQSASKLEHLHLELTLANMKLPWVKHALSSA